MSPHEHAPPRAGRREWLGLATLALPTLLIALDMNVLGLAVPALSADLRPTGTQLLWINDIYGFLIAGFLITMGTLGDRIGRRKLLLIGGAAFGVASAVAAFSVSAEMLILARAALGIAGATLMPSTMSLIRNLFHDPAQRTVAISVWMTSFTAGSALGPLLGAVLLENFWWGSVFLLGVPVMLLLLVFGPLLLPESRNDGAGRVDLASVALSLSGMLATVYGLKKFAETGFDWTAVLAFAGGLALGYTFLRRQRTLDEPLLDLGLFAHRGFTASITVQTLAVFGIAGGFFFVAQYLQLVLGLSPLEAGLWTVPSTVAGVAGTMLAPAIVRRVRAAHVLGGGLVLAVAGFVLLTFTGPDSGIGAVVAGFGLLSFGFGPAMTVTADLIMGSAPPERTGAASALSETGSELGMALGIALLGSIGTAVYRVGVTEGTPAGVPPELATVAHDTLGGAVTVAAELPAGTADQLLTAARAAFTDGFHVNSWISAALTACLAVLAVVLLRPVTEPAAPERTRVH
ncbi:MFS transporter [Amycolatopsis magusensis]|uniref:DHA2 family multidrug resistance protein-like MFS transporter n=1 Tax=Amycolatopsis magusensis TaxID=882444 RepID=A0ABS4PWZ8_9PSEU|nr:MFS transporter [Amycolatopsis magusensis]MBP2183952.1 DHA2 family multidrug resistance protein-like MFS transporter [Amycolatopsis magusensis]